MKHLFQALPDSTPPTLGQEIGAAVSPIMEAVQADVKRQEMLLAMLTQAIGDAVRAISATGSPETQRTVTEWRFDVQRDAKTDSLIGVTAKAVAFL